MSVVTVKVVVVDEVVSTHVLHKILQVSFTMPMLQLLSSKLEHSAASVSPLHFAMLVEELVLVLELVEDDVEVLVLVDVDVDVDVGVDVV